jgi:Ca-activated chloride channel family protein
MGLHLMRPEWLWLLLPAAILGLWLWQQRGSSGSWSDVIEPELLPHLVGESTDKRSFNPLPLILVAWVLATVAAAGPSWNKIPQPIHQKQDALVIVLDLSYSMKSADLAPSRIDRARQKLMDLLETRREGQTGLIAYAGDAHIVTPLTDDTPTIANLLPALHPDMMPVPGSDPVAGVAQAVELLHSAGIRNGRILLVTDGVAEKQIRPLQKTLAGTGAGLALMAVGTETGAPIPLPRGGFLKDADGTIVMPALEMQTLRQLTGAAGGRFMPMQIDDSDLDYLLADDLLPDTGQTLALDRTADAWEDQGYWLVLLLLPVALGLFRRGWILCLLPLLLVAQPRTATAQSWDDLWLTPDQQGQRVLQAQDYEAAAELFEDSDWAGTAAYRGEDYEGAVEHFSGDDGADDWYNRGNALARAGKLDEAIEAYRESLQIQPGQQDAEDNLALLEQLQQQQEQQQQGEQGDQQQEGEQQEQEQQNQGQQGGDQQSEGQQNQEQSDQGQQAGDQQDSGPSQGQSGEGEQPESGQQEQQPGESTAQDEQEQGEGKQPMEAGQEEQRQAGEQKLAEATQEDLEERERDQAMEQWLRRVPDDPSGLLREKFRYESRKRQQQGAVNQNEQVW